MLTVYKSRRRLAAMNNLNPLMHKPVIRVARKLAWHVNRVTVCYWEKVIN